VEEWFAGKGMTPVGIERGAIIMATDGSMGPVNIKINEKRKVSGTCISNDGKEVGALVEGITAVVMHGELLRIKMALTHVRMEKVKEVLILSDYQNVVRRIQCFQEDRTEWGNSWYIWIYKL
jgi:hypothetical protein